MSMSLRGIYFRQYVFFLHFPPFRRNHVKGYGEIKRLFVTTRFISKFGQNLFFEFQYVLSSHSAMNLESGMTVKQLCSNFKLTVGGYKESQATFIIKYKTVPVMVTVTFYINADCYPNCQTTVIIMWVVTALNFRISSTL